MWKGICTWTYEYDINYLSWFNPMGYSFTQGQIGDITKKPYKKR